MSSDSAAPSSLEYDGALAQAIDNAVASGIEAIDEAGRKIHVNDAFCRMVGWSREELIGARPPFAYWPEEERQRIQEAFQLNLQGCFPREGMTLTFRRRNGERFPVLVLVAPLLRDGAHRGWVANFVDLSSQVAQAEALRKREMQHRTILQTAMDGFWRTNMQGRLIEVNDAYCRMSGYSREELLAMHAADLEAGETAEEVAAHIRRLVDEREDRFESLHRRKDGSVFEVEVSVQHWPDDGGFNVAFLRDVTGRNRAQEALRTSELRNRTILETAMDGFCLVDGEGRLVEVNDAYCRMSGYSRQELLAMRVWDLDVVDTADVVAARLQQLKEQGMARFESRQRRKDGTLIDVDVSIQLQPGGSSPVVCFVRDISRRKAAERALKASEERYRSVVEDQTEIIARFQSDGTITFVNDVFCRFFGKTRQDLIGRKWQPVAVPADVPGIERQLRSLSPATPAVVVENRVHDSTGEVRWVQFVNRALFDNAGRMVEIQTVGRDITERKRVEEALERSERLLRDAQQAAGVGCYITSLETGVWECTPVMNELFGITEAYPHTIEGWVRFMHPDFAQPMDDYLRSVIRERKPFDAEYKMIRPSDGAERWMHGLGRITYDESGRAVSLTGTVQDITERKRVDAALRAARDAADAASRAKSEFLAKMSHEIRTPMNVILGLTQLLERERAATDHAEILREIRDAGDSLLRIINDILDVSRIEAGQLRIERQPFDLAALLLRIDNLLRNAATRKGLSLRIEARANDPGRLQGDSLRLEQVLVNLIDNAIKFSEHGGIDVEVIPLSATPTAVRLRFEVRDTGIGIAPSVIGNLFEPFAQADTGIARRYGGTGLGLAICKGLVGQMGGQIGVASEVGRGSTFWVEIPFERAYGDSCAPAAASAGETPRQGPVLEGLRILAVDDNRMNLFVVERILMREGATVVPAADGMQALQILRAQPQGFDVVLMDVQMPVMDGLAATRAIRADPDLAAIAVIALTAGAMPEEREAAVAAGVDGFIAKPLVLGKLVEALSPFVHSRPAGAGAAGAGQAVTPAARRES
jgi:PAS domain S-box-containing protein